MKPVWKSGKLTVELHKPDVAVLEKALAIGQALWAMNQASGTLLVEAIVAILGNGDAADE